MKKVVSLTLLACASVSGCSLLDNNPVYGDSGYIRDRSQDYEAERESKRLEIPPHLQSRSMKEQLKVPPIDITASRTGEEYQVPRPEFFYADGSSEKVNLKRQDGERMIVVDEPADQVWSALRDFWQFNDVKLAKTDPVIRAMETEWIDTKGKEPGMVETWAKRLTFRDINNDFKDKLRVTLKPYPGDAERTFIRMQHYRASAAEESPQVNWGKDAKDLGYKTEMMYEMLRYLSKSTQQSGTSMVALQSKKPGSFQFGRDARGNPVLKIDANADLAWSLVDSALDSAQIDVGTRDQSKGLFYLSYVSSTPAEKTSEMGFFEWLHSDRGDIKVATSGLTEALGFESENEDGEKVYYSANATDAQAPEAEVLDEEAASQKRLQEAEGFKIWLGNRVVYVFGEEDSNKGSYNQETDAYEFTGRYQLKLNRTRTGVFLSILNDQGLKAPEVIAEEILWDIKENLPQS
ncbi:outer membrane protein assembly factor BamC [Marinobacterium jannaschii]|uniref:outer membrane protein assembly factor BamC n=1 Tax=Marinobacterium jannaschii TaxID=64970 RepID=UPI0004858B40|nr:outer membrane protein assembly factor BamC [Marinobacterium jannaschii]